MRFGAHHISVPVDFTPLLTPLGKLSISANTMFGIQRHRPAALARAWKRTLQLAAVGLVACTTATDDASAPTQADASAPTLPKTHRPVFVVSMENHDANQIYGNSSDAPYINGTLLEQYAHSVGFQDALPELASQPHYILMEAGTNELPDHSFVNDDPPSESNSTSSKDHLASQIELSNNGLTWMSYQEGIDETTGRCPISASGFYHPKHNPFVYFRDVSGSPPSKDDAHCAEHHRDLSQLEDDLGNHSVASYNFITPSQCNDMHGQAGCPDTNMIRAGDAWLATHLPALISFVEANDGVIFVTWDEGDKDRSIPFVAIGTNIKAGYTSMAPSDHLSLLKTVELVLGLPVLPAVESASTLEDMFVPGTFP